MRERLTYANVVATVALFIALGGSTYAAVKLDGGDIRKRSIPGNRLKPNAVKGKQVAEGSLRKVRTAGRADSAAAADTAARADTAAQADLATQANLAANASQLEGAGAAAFARSSRFLNGTGDPTATTPQTIVSVPGLVSITTDGDADDQFTIRFVQESAASLISLRTSSPTGVGTVVQGDATAFTASNLAETFVVRAVANPERAVLITCHWAVAASSSEVIGCTGQAAPEA